MHSLFRQTKYVTCDIYISKWKSLRWLVATGVNKAQQVHTYTTEIRGFRVLATYFTTDLQKDAVMQQDSRESLILCINCWEANRQWRPELRIHSHQVLCHPKKVFYIINYNGSFKIGPTSQPASDFCWEYYNTAMLKIDQIAIL